MALMSQFLTLQITVTHLPCTQPYNGHFLSIVKCYTAQLFGHSDSSSDRSTGSRLQAATFQQHLYMKHTPLHYQAHLLSLSDNSERWDYLTLDILFYFNKGKQINHQATIRAARIQHTGTEHNLSKSTTFLLGKPRHFKTGLFTSTKETYLYRLTFQ